MSGNRHRITGESDGNLLPRQAAQAHDLSPLAEGSRFFFYTKSGHLFRSRDVFDAFLRGELSQAERDKIHELALDNDDVHNTLAALLSEFEDAAAIDEVEEPAREPWSLIEEAEPAFDESEPLRRRLPAAPIEGCDHDGRGEQARDGEESSDSEAASEGDGQEDDFDPDQDYLPAGAE